MQDEIFQFVGKYYLCENSRCSKKVENVQDEMSRVRWYAHCKKWETEGRPDLFMQGVWIPVSKRLRHKTRYLMEWLSGWQADHIGAGCSLRSERLHHQETVARDRKGLGAATAVGERFRAPRCHLLGPQLGSDARIGRKFRQAPLHGVYRA